jgi:hypothetical protein
MKDLLPTEEGETGKSDDWSFERQSFLENVGVVLPMPTTLTRNSLPKLNEGHNGGSFITRSSVVGSSISSFSQRVQNSYIWFQKPYGR